MNIQAQINKLIFSSQKAAVAEVEISIPTVLNKENSSLKKTFVSGAKGHHLSGEGYNVHNVNNTQTSLTWFL